jgi:beta-glucosidase
MEARIDSLVQEMTLEEKVSLVAGDNLWTTVSVKRLGIPPMKVTDGPNGARGQEYAGNITSACFPVGVALAATWNTDLVTRVGVALGEETKAKGAHVLLGPTVNIHRSPLSGRNFECYSEDPYLSARMAIAYVSGVQSQNVGTSTKHFVCNDSEFERMTISSEVTERALREIYLPPFKAAVTEAGSWSVMAAYNKLNGAFCSENARLLHDILKTEWGFEGFVVSDWTGTRSTVDAANNGLDLEMPGPAVWMGDKLLKAVQTGRVRQEVIDDKVRRLLRVMIKTGALDSSRLKPEEAIDKPEHRRLIRETGGEGIVLLKNADGILPLDAKKVRKLAIIGPNAKAAKIQGGGSAQVLPHYVVTPLNGITARAGAEVEIVYHLGCISFKSIPPIDTHQLAPGGGAGEHGLTVEFFNSPDLAGEPVWTEKSTRAEWMWIGGPSPLIDKTEYSVRLSGTFTPAETGKHTFSLVSIGLSRLYINDEEVLDNWDNWQPGGELFFGAAGKEARAEAELTAGQRYRVRVEFSKGRATPLAGLRLGHLPPIARDSIEQAAALAAEADVALLFVGLGREFESEGFDRTDVDLPSEQIDLIKAVAAANPNTVVILQTGSPVTMDWLGQVGAVLQAWYPGQECGNAIADVLFGDVNPSGRLPQTFPKRLQDNPAYINYPGENGQVYYGEGIFVGYRYYDKKDIEPLFPFGYGLSYTTFAYSDLTLHAAAYDVPDRIRVSVDVTNTGPWAGKEVVQLFVRDVHSRVIRPEKELKGFQKVHLEPGETKTVTFELSHAALAYYDTDRQGWLAEAGEFEVLVGSSSRDIRVQSFFTLTNDAFVPTRPESEQEVVHLTTDSTLQELLANEESKAILLKHFPDMLDAPQLSMAMGMSLDQIAGFAPDVFTAEVLQTLDEEFAQLAPVAASSIQSDVKPALWQRLLIKLASWRARRR